MLIAQDEARFKFCPLLKDKDGKVRFCVGSDCMMWRYKHLEKRSETDQGYCGLSGKPAGAM